MSAWRLLSEVLLAHFGGGGENVYLAMGGSTINSFGTRDSDLDLCLTVWSPQSGHYDERCEFLWLKLFYCIKSFIMCTKMFCSIAHDVLARALKILRKEAFVGEVDFVNTARVGFFT